jgi:hypothetical protein
MEEEEEELELEVELEEVTTEDFISCIVLCSW